MSGVSGGEITLVFELAALKRLSRPGEVVTDAKRWSEHVGVISDEPADVVRSFLESHDVDHDFVSGEKGKAGGLTISRQRFPTDRHVFVGTTDEGRSIAEALGWESLSIAEAAKKAEWVLDRETDGVASESTERTRNGGT